MNKEVIINIKKLLKKVGIKFKSIANAKSQLSQKGLVLVAYGFNCGIVKKEHEELWYEMQYLNNKWGEEK